MLEDLTKKFMPGVKEEFSMVELAQMMCNPKIDSLMHIEDWALSRMFVFC